MKITISGGVSSVTIDHYPIVCSRKRSEKKYSFVGRMFQENHWNGGGVEYLILNFSLPTGHVKLNIQSVGDIISFRI